MDAAEIATNYEIPTKEFAKDHHGRDDIAIFDFTAMYQCEFSTVIREKHGQRLVMTIVGDGLIEVQPLRNYCFVLKMFSLPFILGCKIYFKFIAGNNSYS